MLSTDPIVHRFGDSNVLRAPPIELSADDHCALVGPSGAGKSTFLNVLAGILKPSVGSVRLDGQDLYPPQRRDDRWRGRHIGMVPQKLHLLAGLTAFENVALACYFAGTSPDSVAPLLAELGLAQRSSARPAELSVGEQQRAAIARAIVNRPRLLLADEPTSSLDDDNAQRALDLLFDAAKRAGALLIVATHDARIRGRFGRQIELSRPA